MRQRTAIAIYVLFIALVLAVVARADTPQGDVDQNGRVDISDAVALVNYIFLGIEPPRLEWWERDTVATLLVFDGRTYIMENHNIEHWWHYVVAGSDTGKVEWFRIGESQSINGKKFVEVK